MSDHSTTANRKKRSSTGAKNPRSNKTMRPAPAPPVVPLPDDDDSATAPPEKNSGGIQNNGPDDTRGTGTVPFDPSGDMTKTPDGGGRKSRRFRKEKKLKNPANQNAKQKPTNDANAHAPAADKWCVPKYKRSKN